MFTLYIAFNILNINYIHWLNFILVYIGPLCASLNVKLHWNSIKKRALDIMTDLTGKVERKSKQSWITQETVCKMDKQRK